MSERDTLTRLREAVSELRAEQFSPYPNDPQGVRAFRAAVLALIDAELRAALRTEGTGP